MLDDGSCPLEMFTGPGHLPALCCSAKRRLPDQSMTEALPTPPFIAGAPGLDFLNSLWIPVDVEVEGLADGQRLLEWLGNAALLSRAVIDEVRNHANPAELDAVSDQARALREWFRGFVTKHRGRPLASSALSELQPLNRLLARDAEFSQLMARARSDAQKGLPFQLVAQRRWASPDTLLLPLARSLAALIANEDFSHVKHCEGQGCILHFLDLSRDHRRRWCSMAVCGNRAKQAKLRERRAAG